MTLKTCVLFCMVFGSALSACNFPSKLKDADWLSSVKGLLSFNQTHLTGYDIGSFTGLSFECYLYDGGHFIIKSNEFDALGGNFVNAFVCLKFEKITDQKYLYYLLTSKIDDINEHVILIDNTATSVTSAEVCTAASDAGTIQNAKMLVKDGYMTSERIQCPDVILGKYDILADSRVNSLACSSPVWNGCTDIQTMSVSEKGVLCNGTYFFSENASASCLYSGKTSDDEVIVYTYNYEQPNLTDTSNALFTCMVISKNSTGSVFVTMRPNECNSTQTSTSLSDDDAEGQTLEMKTKLTCVPVITTPSKATPSTTTATSTMSAGLVGGIIAIVVVAVAAVVIVVVIVIIKKKNAKKVDPRIIDKEVTDVEETEKSRELDAVTPSVVKTEMSARNGVSHGKLTQVLGPEYTMSNATDEKKAEAVETAAEYHYVELHELESTHKLPPIETGHTPREALSPLDTQLKKSTLPAIK